MSDAALREKLPASPAEILSLLPKMGQLMLSARSGGATHERIGAVGSVTVEGNVVTLGGAAHDSRLDLSAIDTIVADRSGKMRDKVLPRLECRNAQGETLYSLIGLEGLEPFDAPLAAIGAGEALPLVEKSPPGAGATDVPADDFGAASFAAIRATGAPIAIELRAPGLFQVWRGVAPEAKNAMGFVNLMLEDFHLHLKAGAVHSWRRAETKDGVELHALGAQGEETGLVLSGPAEAFAGVAAA